MALDVTTLALAVDSSQVSTANTVLDRFAVAGERAEGASARLAKASADHGRAINTALVPAANKGALAFRSLAEAQQALGPAAAAQLAAAGAFATVATQAGAAKTEVQQLGDQAQRTALTWREFLGQRMGPAMQSFADQGMPHKDAHTAAIRQIAAEWQQYKVAGVTAQAAVAAQAGATTAAITAMGNAVQQAGAKTAGSGRTSGLGGLAADAARAKAEITDLSRATTSLGASSFVNFDKVSTSLGAAAAKADEATLAVHRLRAEIALTGPLAGATTSLGAVTGPANRPAAGLRGAIEQRDAEERARRALDPRLAISPAVNPAAMRPVVAGNEAIGKSAKLAAFQQQQLGFQIHDFFVQIASGSNPLTAFIQQGSQLSGTFGGAGNAFRAITSLITPMRAAMIAAAAAVGGLALVLARAESAARDLATVQAQLSGTGREGLFSTSELRTFINELAQAPGVTRETATAIVSELSKVHDIGGGLFKDLAGMAADYAKATGTDIPSAAKALAKAFADPERGAKQLEETLGTLTSTQLLQIESLTRQGNVAGAQRVLFDALQASVKGLADNAMTPLQRSVNGLGNSWERALQQLDNSEGLRTLNTLLARTVEFVDFLVRNADKVGGLGNIGVSMLPGIGAPAAIANAVTAPFRGAAPKNPVASGRVTDLTGAAAAGAAGPAGANNADDEIKRALAAGKAYRSQAGELADLGKERAMFNGALSKSIALYGQESEQAQKLRQAIAGVDERMAAVRKRGAGGNEGQQVLDAQLEQRLKASRDILDRERDAMAFQQRYLQGVFQSGALSLVDFYAEKRAAIERGTAAELAALDKERADVERHLAATIRTSPKDLSAQERDRTRLADIQAQAEKVRLSGARETILADQQQAESLKNLTEQVTTYRASLLELQGDEAGAARLRAQQAIQQASLLAAQSQRSATPITAADLSAYERAIDSQNRLAAARQATSHINDVLAQEEDRIALAVRTGAIGELEAMSRAGAARAKLAADLEKIVQAQEEIAARFENRGNWQLQIDTSRARLELEKLKAEINPLKKLFDDALRGAGENFLSDLMNAKKPLDALKAAFNSIGAEINSVVSKQLSQQVFGEGKILGGAGGFLADIFGKKGAGDTAAAALAGSTPVVDTSAITASLVSLQAAGVDPATAALGRLQLAADAAAGSVGAGRVPGMPSEPALTTGDFARIDRGQTTGESAVMGLFKDADKSSAALAKSNDQAATSILQFASAAARGGDALSRLPGLIQTILAAASASSASGGGGGLFGALGSLFGGGGGTFAGTTGLEGMSPDTLALFFAEGGYTGNKGERQAAGVVHGKEYVFSAPAVRRIGVPALERMHRSARTGAGASGLPGYADGGFVTGRNGPETLMMVPATNYLVRRGDNADTKPAARSGDVYHLNITVPMPVGGTRETAMQFGAAAGRQIQTSLRRNS